MSVSKRLRYEILRRDNFQCRYCGGTAPDTVLTVDHVLPVALGGSDDPGNLVAACKDCNAGKSASNPEEPLLDQVSEEAIQWAKAVQMAADQAHQDFQDRLQGRNNFFHAWNQWNNYAQDMYFDLPDSFPASIDCFRSRGLSDSLIRECISTAMTKKGIADQDRFRYFCGVAWRKIANIDSVAKQIYESMKSGGPDHAEMKDEIDFPFMDFVDEIIIDIVRALTQADQGDIVYRAAARALWDGMPVADRVFRREINAAISAGIDPHAYDDDAEESAYDRAFTEAVVAMNRETAIHIHQLWLSCQDDLEGQPR